jgi:glutamyl-tRNA reductase
VLISFSADHHRLPARARSQFALAVEEQNRLLHQVARLHCQAFVLCTCNRAELLTWVPGARHRQEAAVRVTETARRLRPDLAEVFFQSARLRSGRGAVRHTLRVASGLESQVPGDNQILGQVREAYIRAQQAGTAGPHLHRLLQTALRTGKRVRHETPFGRRDASIGALAAAEASAWLSTQQLGRRASAVLLGAGKAAQSALEPLLAAGVDVTLVNRTPERALELARHVGSRVAEFSSRHRLVAQADVAIVTTGAPEPLIEERQLREARSETGACERLLLIDLSLPANIDAAARGLDQVHLLTLDQLRGGRPDAGAQQAATRIVEQEVAGLMRWISAREGAVPRVA